MFDVLSSLFFLTFVQESCFPTPRSSKPVLNYLQLKRQKSQSQRIYPPCASTKTSSTPMQMRCQPHPHHPMLIRRLGRPKSSAPYHSRMHVLLSSTTPMIPETRNRAPRSPLLSQQDLPSLSESSSEQCRACQVIPPSASFLTVMISKQRMP